MNLLPLRVAAGMALSVALVAPVAGCSSSSSGGGASSSAPASSSAASSSGASSAAASESGAAAINLTGTTWNLTAGTVDSVDMAKFKITIEFSKDAVSGFGGVNQYNGPYKTTKAGDIKIGPLASTKMAGPDDAMAAEAAYLAALGAVNHYAASDTKLTLTTPVGLSLVYSKAS